MELCAGGRAGASQAYSGSLRRLGVEELVAATDGDLQQCDRARAYFEAIGKAGLVESVGQPGDKGQEHGIQAAGGVLMSRCKVNGYKTCAASAFCRTAVGFVPYQGQSAIGYSDAACPRRESFTEGTFNRGQDLSMRRHVRLDLSLPLGSL